MADILPQLIEFASQLDLQRVILLQTTICLFGAMRSVPAYNIPLLFFGLYAYDHHDSVDPLQQPVSIISALQLLKYRGDPFSNLGEGLNWSGHRSHGYANGSPYQTLAEGMEDERDAEEISIPRHHHQHGRHRGSHQSSSFMTNSSRSGSLKSNRTGSGHNVELGHHGNGYDSSASGGGNSGHGVGPTPVSGALASGGAGGTGGAVAAKDERGNKVGQNISEDEEEDVSSHEGTPGGGPGNARAGYQPF
ncbi:hypothetical protein BGZ96_010717 [Linnemannia gamsii]|uniref:Uncharacterized protein n=1 Tax=Linnemannia gamsii TaxID=64522 RepID=A0ABQ7JTR2_9FUNG|nr:hypothetical protein BGZ96_010717 [Linnemannia gamsii]